VTGVAAVADVTNGFGWGYQVNHPNPRSHPRAIFPDIAYRDEHDAPRTTVGGVAEGARPARPARGALLVGRGACAGDSTTTGA